MSDVNRDFEEMEVYEDDVIESGSVKSTAIGTAAIGVAAILLYEGGKKGAKLVKTGFGKLKGFVVNKAQQRDANQVEAESEPVNAEETQDVK